jgi:hypothetical protein
MAPKAAQDRAKKKAAKQKKLLMLLVIPMLGALVYAYTTMSGLGGKTQVAAPPTAAPAPAGSTPTAAAATPGATVTPGIAAVQVTPLNSFTTLGVKDPFHDHGPNPGATPKPHSSTSGKSKGKSGSASTTKPPSAPLTGAVISINGKKLALAVGAEFGQAPGLSGVSLFRLIKVSPTTALIGVVGTQQQFMLHVKKPLKLEQEGGWSYTLILEPLGSAAPMTAVPPTATTGQ